MAFDQGPFSVNKTQDNRAAGGKRQVESTGSHRAVSWFKQGLVLKSGLSWSL